MGNSQSSDARRPSQPSATRATAEGVDTDKQNDRGYADKQNGGGWTDAGQPVVVASSGAVAVGRRRGEESVAGELLCGSPLAVPSVASSYASNYPADVAVLNTYHAPLPHAIGRRPSLPSQHRHLADTLPSAAAQLSTTASATIGRRRTSALNSPGQTYPTIILWNQGGQRAYVTGSFNNWKEKIPMWKGKHDFTAVLNLPPGTHRLKFIVDDVWLCLDDLETMVDSKGNLVNYIHVVPPSEDDLLSPAVENNTSRHVEETYTRTIPDYLQKRQPTTTSSSYDNFSGGYGNDTYLRSFDALSSTPTNFSYQKSPLVDPPHALPSYLDRIILNQHVNSSHAIEDSGTLPIPHHVALNRIYALSIRDDVMGLSTTMRFRNKYVTTVFYRSLTN